MFKSIVLYGSLLLMLFGSCATRFDKLLKSKDVVSIQKQADLYFNEKKYSKALALYENAYQYSSGTPMHKPIMFKIAECYQLDKAYFTAAKKFENYHTFSPKDSLAQKALFLSAQNFYWSSDGYELDQEPSRKSIDQFQKYLDMYPNADNADEINRRIEELEQRMEKKDFEIAKSYYSRNKFTSAITSLQNVIEEYPRSKNIQAMDFLIYYSTAKLALNSIAEKKKQRLEDAFSLYQKNSEKYSEKFINDNYATIFHKNITFELNNFIEESKSVRKNRFLNF